MDENEVGSIHPLLFEMMGIKTNKFSNNYNGWDEEECTLDRYCTCDECQIRLEQQGDRDYDEWRQDQIESGNAYY